MAEVLFIVDNSYSVMAYIQHYLDAINNIIKIQKDLSPNSLHTLITFNQNYNYLYLRKQVSSINPISVEQFNCHGENALYDSVTSILLRSRNFRERIKTKSPICIILTNGVDNLSKKYNIKLCAFQIMMCRQAGFYFIFLGTTEESIQIGRAMGCNACIMYLPIKKSLDKVVLAISEMFQKPAENNIKLDLRDLAEETKKNSL